MVDADLTGVSEVLKNITKWSEKNMKEYKRRLVVASGEVESRAVKLAPNVTGELRARSFSGELYEENGVVGVIVGFEKGGMAYPTGKSRPTEIDGKMVYPSENLYSVYVHEINKNYHNGSYKFLENALKSFEGEMLQYLAGGKK